MVTAAAAAGSGQGPASWQPCPMWHLLPHGAMQPCEPRCSTPRWQPPKAPPTHRHDAAHWLPGAAGQLLLKAGPAGGRMRFNQVGCRWQWADGRRAGWQPMLAGHHVRAGRRVQLRCNRPCLHTPCGARRSPSAWHLPRGAAHTAQPAVRVQWSQPVHRQPEAHQSHWLGTGLLLSTTHSNSCTHQAV